MPAKPLDKENPTACSYLLLKYFLLDTKEARHV